ncbi:MAG: hypothetical protein KA419_14080 [Acidobacteria bacterium]|nr:hypothetical protein [Acidobacteriota bacterium]
MGLKDFFSQYREKQDKRKYDKLVRRLCQKFAQSYERYAAADELGNMEGEDAIFGLLQRFGFQSPQIIEDEEEKRHVYHLVLERGEEAVPAILRYIREKESLVYPLRLLREIAGDEACRAHIMNSLKDFAPEYNRAPEKKTDLIAALGEYSGPGIVDALLPFLADPNDDVVVGSLDILSRHVEEEERVRDAFLALLTADEEKPRVQRRVLELLKDLKWKVTGFRKKVEEKLPPDFYIDKKGFIKRLGES